MSNNITSQIDIDLSVFEVINGKVNLTKICQHFNKRLDHWLKSQSTQRFLEAYSKLTPNGGIITLVGKGKEQGTFGDRRVALKLAEWISVDFELFANEKLDELLQTGKAELTQTKQEAPSYQIEDPIKRAETWILEQKEKQKLEIENNQQAIEIKGLANNLKETKETLAKNYKTIQSRNKAEIGNSINRLVIKFFKTDDISFSKACHKAWDCYYETTGVHYYGAVNSSFEEKLSFLNFLLSL